MGIMSDCGVVITPNERLVKFEEIRSFLEAQAVDLLRQGATVPEVHLLLHRLLTEALLDARNAVKRDGEEL